MKRPFRTHHLVLLPLPILGVWWVQRGYGDIRHLISWAGVGYLGLAATYLLRIHWLRKGSRRAWLRFHRTLALTGLGLIAVHTALRPYSWHAATSLGLVLLMVGSGFWLSYQKGEARLRWRRVHLLLIPLLLLSIVAHGILRPRHDTFFPLEGPHKVACVQCHRRDHSYRTNSCLACHPHNTPEVRQAHELHGIREAEYQACLDCHTVTIRETRYGRPRAPGHNEIPWK